MTHPLLRACAALAPIVSWALVAPASTQHSIDLHRDLPTFSPPQPDLVDTPSPETSVPSPAAPVALVPPEPASSASALPQWRRLLRREVTPGVVASANSIIRSHHTIGEEVPFAVAGRTYLARIEEHYHPPGGDKFPWGPHPGVSVFVAGSGPNP